ncbi:MAG: folylpolyglutamate synthase/dihydrofolate synthase family protein [Smithellaceae bacterium]|jgi:dihydrofolate synthase/folylpolyglutamate synthase
MKKFDPSAYLAGLNVDIMHFGLESIAELLSRLGNPQNDYRTILIAGTNGKGSTATMAASILESAGYKAGLYTSPHLVDVRERIVINGKKITRNDFNQIIVNIKEKLKNPLTYFELLTVAAFVYFQRRKVDIAVLEVGLGGRLDATNVCKPLVSIITNIAFDHMAYLGNTLESIAIEKAGIIKQNGICLTAAKQKNVLQVLKNICAERKANLYRLGADIKIIKQKNSFFAYQGLYRKLNGLTISLQGEHQLANAALAVAAVELSDKNGLKIDNDAIRAGLKKACLDARLEVLQKEPLFLLDGAHNPAGINSLCRAFKKDFSYKRLILIFSSLIDKDYCRMLKKIAPLANRIILTKLKTTRGEASGNMRKILEKIGYKGMVTENVGQAIRKAQSLAGKQDLICATGSLYLAGEVKQKFPKIVSCAKKH